MFQEHQRFNQWWVWGIIIGVTSIPLIGIYYQTTTGNSFGNNPLSNEGLAIAFIPMLGLLIFMRMLQLKTKITPKSIHFHFFPLVRKKIDWEEVANAEVVDYGFVGGWGIRLFTSYGTVYNIRGRFGLALELKSGKKLLIGTQKPEALKAFIAQL
ncbi:MAG: hypothetical protein P8N20_00785 [Flavobacteriaceae bacterium]|nr:hypothetical protein [Flavobacteriaceae bacterium]